MKYKLLRFSLLSMLIMFFGGLAFADQVTMKYSGTETSNMTGENDAALFGLDAGAWSVVSDKGGNSNMPGLNKAGDFRLYWSANGGNTITVQSLNQETINSIAITFTGASYSNVSVTVDGNAVTGTDGVFDINSTSFVLGNANTSNTQVRISEIVITYGEAGQVDNRLATTLTLGEHQTTGVVNESMDCPTVTVTGADGAPIQYDYIDWTSSDETVAGIADGNIGFLKAGTTTITAKFPGDNNYKPSSASFTLTITEAPYTSIAAMLADITSTRTTATYQFENLLVTYVNGSNTYVSDGRNGFLFYGANLGLNAGEQITGTATGQIYTYNGLPEMAVSADGISAQVVSEGNLVAWPTIPAADLQSYINIPVTIENAVFVEASGKNLTFKVGDEEFAVYNQWSIAVGALEAGTTYTLTGVGSVYSKGETTTYQLYLVNFEATGGQPVDERLDLTLSFPQESYEATMGEDFEEPVLTIDPKEYDGMISYKSSNAEVATVSYDGEVTLVGPGTVIITAEANGSNTYKDAEASYTLTVKEAETPVEPGEIANPYTFTFESKVFAAEGTQMLANANWTLATDAGYFGYDGTKGQQFGSSKAAATTITLTTADIPGTITKVVVNTSGASAIDASFGVSVGETAFQYAGDAAAVTTSAALTNTATDYEFTGSASGAITLSWANNSAKAIYVKSIYVEYTAEEQPAQWAWADIKADFTNQNFLTDEEKAGIAAESNKNPSLNFGLLVDSEGNVTRIDKDAPNANAVINAKWHSNEHGLSNFSATVPVDGAVKITFGTCAWGGDVTVKNADGETVATMNTNTGACYHNDKENNIVSCFYKDNVATTLTISGGSYVPYFAVEKVDPADLKEDVVVTFFEGDAQGVAPAAITVEVGKTITIPQNFTLYKEGHTLTAWTTAETAGSDAKTFVPGEEVTVDDNMILGPVFTENKVTLADRTEAVTVKFDFQKNNGAPNVQWENQDNLVWVAQAQVNGATIDVPTHFSTAPGKFNNTNWGDWCQINEGTTFAIPSCKGATISIEGYNVLGEPAKEGQTKFLTIDGQNDYTHAKTVSYEIAGNSETVDVVIGEEGSYYRYIQVVLPKVEQQGGGESYENATATIEWPMDEPANYSKSTATPDGVFSTVAVDLGVVRLMDQNGNENATGTSNVSSGVTFTQMRPTNGGSDFVTWVVKPAAGLTFTPTKITAYIVRFGTDAESGVTFSAKAGEGDAVTLGTYTAPRNNKSKADDKFGSSKDYAENGYVEIELTEAQQTALTSGEGFSLMGTIGVGNAKAGGIAQVTVSGLINGTKADVAMYTLATAVAPEEAGSINVYPAADQYEEGSEVTLTATENFGYDFVNWTNAAGEEVSADAKFKYTVNADETLTANFVAVETYELSLAVDGTNDYMVTVSPAPTMVDGKMMYEEGTAVQLTANQYEGLVTFTNWSDGETNSSKLISMTENIQLTAMYAQADIIAGWDFYKAGSNGRKADFFAQDNDADALNLVNTETGDVQGWLDKSTLGGGGYESFAGAAVNWRTGTQNGDVGHWHWQTKINAEAFTDINVQFQMLYNYNAYQTYNAEYSLDGENWTKFGSITMTGTKAPASFSEQLPAEANNQKDLFIRMIADKTSNVDGAASANDGNTLAMFFIIGTPKLIDDGKAPELVSTVPADGATGASASGKIVLTFDERVKLADTFMPTGYINDVRINSNTQNPVTPIVNGKTVTFEYKGLEYSTEYAFRLPGGSIADLTNNFIADEISLTFTTMERPSVDKKMYDYVVENVDELLAAIAAAQARSDKNVRYRIFIKNGEYTIPVDKNKLVAKAEGYEVPECITFINTDNVSFIGESRDGVIITNGLDPKDTFTSIYGTTSKYDGIGNSDVFQLRGQGYYWQDLTVETGMDDATGRDLAIHDRGTKNIYKNVGLRGYQDTWTSNNDNGLYYFEDGYVRGRTDYMCGKGDIFWNGVELRQIAGGYAAVPSKPAKYGWIYKDCVINGEGSGVDGNYTLGRPWGSGTPIALFIDTRMNVVPSAIGWNEMSGGWPKRFAEYNSMTSTGSQIDLSGRKHWWHEGGKESNPTVGLENNPVLTAEEALEAGNLHNMFGDWDPTLATEQAPIPTNVELTTADKKLTWTDSNYALLYAIVKNGKVVDFTLDNNYTVDDVNAVWTIRAANEMGGLGEASEAASITTGITTVETSTPVFNGETYTMQGIRVDKARKGLYIVNGRKVVIK